jgi:hypothetical protein
MDPVAGFIVAGGTGIAALLAWSAARMADRKTPRPPVRRIR